MIDIKKLTGENLRRIRLAAGMTQEQLAEHMRVKKQNVSAMETGRRGLSDAVLPSLCEIFACAPAEFFEVPHGRAQEEIGDLLLREIRKMDARKKAVLYAHALALNAVNGSLMYRRAEDQRFAV